MLERGVKVPDQALRSLRSLEEEEATAVMVALNGELLGLIGVADVLREEAKDVIQAIKGMGIKVAILTGDNERAAKAIAEKLGVKEVHANVTPPKKLEKIRELQG